MGVLSLIWAAALGLQAVALAWMLGLIAQRLLQDRVRRRHVAERRAIEMALVAVMQGRAETALALRAYRHKTKLMAETLLDFMGVVRGRDRDRVVEALEAIGVPESLRHGLRRGPWPARLAAAEALSAFPGPATEQALRAMARQDPEGQLTALAALARAGGVVQVGELLSAAALGRMRVSGRFDDFLREQVSADAPAAVAELARADLTPHLRAHLLDALGGSGDYSVIPALIEHARHPDSTVRSAAIHALGRLQHPAGQGAIAAALDDEAPEVRAIGAEAAGEAGLTRLADALYARLSDPAWRVRFQAAASLGKLGEVGRERLRLAARLPDPAAARAATLTLAELGVA